MAQVKLDVSGYIMNTYEQFFAPEGRSLPSESDISGHFYLIQRVTSTFWRKKLGGFWTNPNLRDTSNLTCAIKKVGKVVTLVVTTAINSLSC